MISLKYVSDLHLEFGPFQPERFKGDILILAGDITTQCNSDHLSWIGNLDFKHIIYLFGNHEYYNGSIEVVEEETRDILSRFSNVHVLQNESITLEGLRFHGATLWTDFRNSDPIAMMNAASGMSDFHLIYYDNFSRLFQPYNAITKFEESVDYLKRNVQQGDIVVTHHAPSYKSIHPRFAGNPLNPAFVSDLDWLIEEIKPDYWIHGHTHSSFRYDCHNTKVLCNPRGYFGHEKVDDFRASKTLMFY